jgi:hypothetical protein
MGLPPEGPKPIGVWLGGSPPKRKNVDIAAKWDSSGGMSWQIRQGNAEDEVAGRKEAEEKCPERGNPEDKAAGRKKVEEEYPSKKEKPRRNVLASRKS